MDGRAQRTTFWQASGLRGGTGESLVVFGAGGGIGHLAVQLANASGRGYLRSPQTMMEHTLLAGWPLKANPLARAIAPLWGASDLCVANPGRWPGLKDFGPLVLNSVC